MAELVVAEWVLEAQEVAPELFPHPVCFITNPQDIHTTTANEYHEYSVAEEIQEHERDHQSHYREKKQKKTKNKSAVSVVNMRMKEK